uniref:Glycine N-acyltransferase-like protein n=1 Tax=Knipowitschia caucasica TaxID=637954 RepID=A0AAV2KER0_KNICA
MKTLGAVELQEAEEVLRKQLPKSFKVYGFLHSINRGKPTTLEVVVDSWPDFKVIICRPDLTNKRVMDYTLKVTIFSTDEQIFRTMLMQGQAVDWSLNFLFAGLDVSNLQMIRDVSASKGVNLKTFTNIAVHLLFLSDISDLNSPSIAGVKDRISRHVTYRFGEQHDDQGQPVSWILVYDYLSIGILHTLPEHRRKGYAKVLCGERKPMAAGTEHQAPLFSALGLMKISAVCQRSAKGGDYARERCRGLIRG